MASLRNRALSLAAGLALLAGGAGSQVVISEVMIHPKSGSDVGYEWIEVTNVSSSTVSLSNWCLFVATRKAMGTNKPGNYWWPFPKTGPGSQIPAGGRVVIQWLQDGTNRHVQDPKGDYDQVFTGTTVFDFLFGLFHYDRSKNPPESDMALPNDGGSLGLVRTQDARKVRLPGFWADYLEYGSAGFLREEIPVKAGIWKAGTFVPLPPKATEWPLGQSLAYGYTGNSPLNYWRDRTPTKGQPNSVGATRGTFGRGCSCSTGGNPLFCTLPVPAVSGSRDFRFFFTGALPGAPAVAFISPRKAAFSLLGCSVLLDFSLALYLNPVTVNQSGEGVITLFIPPDPSLRGPLLYGQVFVPSYKTPNATFCSSNGVSFTIGE